MGSGKLLHRAFNKYGIENFTRDIIISGINTLEEANELEKKYIALEWSNNHSEYNIAVGGHCSVGYGVNNHFYHKHHTEESKNKIRNSRLGSHHTDEFKEMVSNTFSESRHMTKDGVTKRVKPELQSEYLNNGWIFGRGIKRVYINKDDIEKLIPESELKSYLDTGWSKGGLKRIPIVKDGVEKKVRESVLDSYLADGWSIGKSYSSTKNRIRIDKGELIKYVTKSDIESYLDEGWTIHSRVV